MNIKVFTTTAILFLSVSTSNHANELRPEHFKGKDAETWAEATNNLRAANAELRQLLQKQKLTLIDSARVHELSYTMENALQTMRATIVETEEVLEQLHLSSESPDLERTKELADVYLEAVQQIEN